MDQVLPRHGKWTKAEDESLQHGLAEHGEKKWRLISECVPGRSPIQCLHRWTKILKPGLVKGSWTKEEDLALENWVTMQGPHKWAQCSKVIPGRNGKQCRERWCNNLDPDVKKGKWSVEEDTSIFNMFQSAGPKWAYIAKFLPGRTENSIKNRFYSTIRKMSHRKKETETMYFPEFIKQEEAEIKVDCDITRLPLPTNIATPFVNAFDPSTIGTFSNMFAQTEYAFHSYSLNVQEIFKNFLGSSHY